MNFKILICFFLHTAALAMESKKNEKSDVVSYGKKKYTINYDGNGRVASICFNKKNILKPKKKVMFEELGNNNLNSNTLAQSTNSTVKK